tara:strand:- start:980 stop:1234 length:255 start_codon:yes stop_codon:yes gene_type:complete
LAVRGLRFGYGLSAGNWKVTASLTKGKTTGNCARQGAMIFCLTGGNFCIQEPRGKPPRYELKIPFLFEASLGELTLWRDSKSLT